MEKHKDEEAEFVEIRGDSDDASTLLPAQVQAYVATVDPPRVCGPLVKRLSMELSLSQAETDLSHLKRVKRTNDELLEPSSSRTAAEQVDEDSKPASKRQRTNGTFCLQVLIGAVSVLDQTFESERTEGLQISQVIQNKYSLALPARKLTVPGRPPESTEEWKAFNSQWPTVFLPNKTKEFREAARQLTNDEIEQMRRGMQAAIDDANAVRRLNATLTTSSAALPIGTVVMDSKSGQIVGEAAREQSLQREQSLGDRFNPLATSILYAIQSISRSERECAMSQGMESANFQKGRYLCTGYDVYTTHEPPVFEAMALVHSRIRRLVIGCRSTTGCGGLTDVKVHALPGTNHKYRVFLCRANGCLSRCCLELSSNK